MRQITLLISIISCLATVACATDMPSETDPGIGQATGALTETLVFGATVTQPVKSGQPATWLFQANGGGTFSLAINSWAKSAPLLLQLQRVVGNSWSTVKTAGGTGQVQVQVTPTSAGQYRAVVQGGKSGLTLSAQLLCMKGNCEVPTCPSTPNQAKASVQSAVGSLISGVLYMSESDRPIEVVALSAQAGNTGAVQPAELLKSLGKSASTVVDKSWTVTKFYQGLQLSGMSPSAVAALQKALESQGTSWTVLRTGQTAIDVWLVGRNGCGVLVGLHTVVVET